MLAQPPSPPDAAPLAFSLPSVWGLSFGVGLYLLALLLQPAVPAALSRPLRLALFLPVAALAYVAPLRWRFEPFELSIPANFRWAIFAPYGILKAVEWGTMSTAEQERELAWVGFDGREEERARRISTAEAKSHKNGAAEGRSTAVAESQNGSHARRRETSLPAPIPLRPASAVPPSLAVPTFDANAQLPTPSPSPSPPFVAVNPPSIADEPHPTASISPLTSAKLDAQSSSQRAHPLRTLTDAAHLLSSLRGIGYTWGPPLRSLARPSTTERAFVRRALAAFALAHAVSTACLAVQVLNREGELAPLLRRAVPALSPGAAQLVSATLARLGIGASLHAQMNIGAEGASLAFYALHRATNALLALGGDRVTWRTSFDLREYPPLFDKPFEAMGEGGLAGFWGQRWHALFRDVFTAVGYRPVLKLARRLGLPKKVGQLSAVTVVFALSAWMHWQALVAARHLLAPTPSGLAFAAAHHLPLSSLYPAPYSSLSFIERHGTWVFFLLQPVAVTLENAWIALTRRKIRGWYGRVWTALWVVVLGQAVVGRSWLALGLVHGLPPVHLWSWERWVLPTFSLAPMPAFMRMP
ncbi:hypothetical protein JCM10450v2_007082 [Rhodotorula kratochvilovae]